MLGVINFRILVPLAALLMPAAVIAAPPREGTASIVPLLSDEECWRKLPPTVKGTGQILPLPSWGGDGRCDAAYDCRNATAGLSTPDAQSARAAAPRKDAMGRRPGQPL